MRLRAELAPCPDWISRQISVGLYFGARFVYRQFQDGSEPTPGSSVRSYPGDLLPRNSEAPLVQYMDNWTDHGATAKGGGCTGSAICPCRKRRSHLSYVIPAAYILRISDGSWMSH